MKRTKINFTIKSLRGKRPINQDSLSCSFNYNKEFCAVICDGVGSVEGSEHASRIVADTFTKEFSKTGHISTPTLWFKQTLKIALQNLANYTATHGQKDIATTVALLLVVGDHFYCYNIGDTRIYLLSTEDTTHTVKQYTYDHNYKNYLIANEASNEELLANEAKWHSLTHYVDASCPQVAKFDANSGVVNKLTYFLLCTDGLYSYVRDNNKYEVISRKHRPLALKLNILNRTAIKNGSDDNVSGILVSVK